MAEQWGLWRQADGVRWRRSLRCVVVVDSRGRAVRLGGSAADLFASLPGPGELPVPISEQGAVDLEALERAGLVVPRRHRTAPDAAGTADASVDRSEGCTQMPVLCGDGEGSILSSLGRWGLGEAVGGPVHDPVEVLPSLLAAARADRVVSLLGAAALRSDADLTDARWDALADAHQSASAAALGLEWVATEVSTRLSAAGVAHRLLKGAAVAAAAGAPSEWRDVGDVDVLVPSGAVGAAVRALRDIARPLEGARLDEGYDEWSGKSVTLRGDEGWEVDLHRTLAVGPWGHLVSPDELWREQSEVDLGRGALPTLTSTLHLCHAVIHAALGDPEPRLQSLRDIALLDVSADVDHDRARAVLDSWRARAPVKRSTTAVLDRLGVQVRVAASSGPHPAVERVWMAAYVHHPRRFGPLAVLALPVAPPGRRRLDAVALWHHYVAIVRRRATREVRTPEGRANPSVEPELRNARYAGGDERASNRDC